jgi:hypothetical protein
MPKKMGKHACRSATFIAPVYCAKTDNAGTAIKSNKPLNLAPGANLQNAYTPKLFDSNSHTNDALLRATLPTSACPDPHNGYSTGTWTFDLKNDTRYIPLGLGGGRVWKSGSNILNAFIEPQWTVEQKGDGLPQFKLFAGINITFGK